MNGDRSIWETFHTWGASEQRAYSYDSQGRSSGAVPGPMEIPAELRTRKAGGGSNDR